MIFPRYLDGKPNFQVHSNIIFYCTYCWLYESPYIQIHSKFSPYPNFAWFNSPRTTNSWSFGASFPDPECDAIAVLYYSSLFLVIPFNIDFGLKTSPILYILSLEASLANSAQCSGMMRDASRSASWFFIWPQLYCIKGSACCGTTCWSLQIWYSMPTWRWRRTETNWIVMRFARTYWTLVIPLNRAEIPNSPSQTFWCVSVVHIKIMHQFHQCVAGLVQYTVSTLW